MFLVGLVSWWYGRGWRYRAHTIGQALVRMAAYFSIGQLLATLFAPFRQISAGRVSGTVAQQLRAFFDKTLSRMVGFVVRAVTIIAGGVTLGIQAVIGGVILLCWPFLPFLPVVGLVLFFIGWTPSWI